MVSELLFLVSVLEMSVSNKDPDAAWKLIKHLVSPQALTDYWQRIAAALHAYPDQ